ncbi:hypothetical protein BBO99_00004376 [Phytophthora kernoviae]|uniref:DNA-directed RNA polymerase III subunit RPC9 n=1 Tax=Phytophthora kernoviae TaxID=325452 RepID=A0A421GRD0_9STRA|nr:hypothetical protein BBI17_004547 [Phytophthora kernoviae]RLN80591.1 hypothetical protein BBO99_00004376 [Phytophthora kernoviae]
MSGRQSRVDVEEEKKEEKEEKAKFPPPPIEIPGRREEEEGYKENRETDDVAKENREDELRAACARLEESDKAENSDGELHLRQRISLRTYPRLALTPLVDSPPSSPRVFRSLENEFAFAMQDTPEIRPRTLLFNMERLGRAANQAFSSQFAIDTGTMKVLLINEGSLSDFEVLQLMQERKEQRLHKSAMVAYAERNWMDHKVLKFLTQSHSNCSTLSTSCIQDFLKELAQAGLPTLTPSEKLQFINHIPSELVDIHLIIEDCAGRFTETQVEELIRIVERTLAAELLEKRRQEQENADVVQSGDGEEAEAE